ncbi:MAG: hypothetical protein IPI49_28575 [Myxococcales bacterium]|nr:hypothetical protein [Myxococcales bacterium]
MAMALKQPRVLDDLRRSMKSKLGDVRRAKPHAPTEHWALEDGYAGIERAQLVVVNVRSADRRPPMPSLSGNKLPVTAVVADLSNPKDVGLKKAVARVKRATKRRER